jgi:hypothetical protein
MGDYLSQTCCANIRSCFNSRTKPCTWRKLADFLDSVSDTDKDMYTEMDMDVDINIDMDTDRVNVQSTNRLVLQSLEHLTNGATN